jgi:hypothetical protein
MADDHDSPDVERTTGEEEPASDEFLRGEIAHAWRDEFDEELTWGDLVRWLGESG